MWQGAGLSGLGAHSCLVYTLQPSPLPGETIKPSSCRLQYSDHVCSLLCQDHIGTTLVQQVCKNQVRSRSDVVLCGCQAS